MGTWPKTIGKNCIAEVLVAELHRQIPRGTLMIGWHKQQTCSKLHATNKLREQERFAASGSEPIWKRPQSGFSGTQIPPLRACSREINYGSTWYWTEAMVSFLITGASAGAWPEVYIDMCWNSNHIWYGARVLFGNCADECNVRCSAEDNCYMQLKKGKCIWNQSLIQYFHTPFHLTFPIFSSYYSNLRNETWNENL
jgi:hypothetical protein